MTAPLNDGAPTPCHRKARLFSSTHPEDHLVAAALCAQCPIREQCLADAMRLRKTPGSYLEGTWGGHLFKSRTFTERVPRPVTAPATPDPTLF